MGTASSLGARVGSVSQLSPWVPPTLLGIQFCVLGPQPHSQARSHALVAVLASPLEAPASLPIPQPYQPLPKNLGTTKIEASCRSQYPSTFSSKHPLRARVPGL